MNENRLQNETSPYLRQHAHQPVAWFAWGQDALNAAAAQDKPIMLSIGYSTCHWCHVMAHESFDDPTTAEILNRDFICIKVDREERPDLDKIYQMAHQLLNQRGGGWPLTVFLRPRDQAPFFAGTYFPPVPRYGMPDFKSLLTNIAELFRAERGRVDDFSEEIKRHLAQAQSKSTTPKAALTAQPLDEARRQLKRDFDSQHGGFGDAPKFPHPTHIERLLRHWALLRDSDRQDTEALAMATVTLEAMAKGGINDQLSGGFFRYSVDERWEIPHFEKMLYDNASLLWCYAAAWDAGKNPLLRATAESIATWMISDMRSPGGGFYSALDADSEGEEGKYYVWDAKQVREMLGDQLFPAFAARFGLDGPANFEGRWHLRIAGEVADIASRFGLPEGQLAELIDEAKRRLLAARTARSTLGLDYKILTAWNGLAIRGLAFAGRTLKRKDWIDAAADAHRFVREKLWIDGTLYASFAEDVARHPAYLDDYAFMLEGSIELLQARYDDETLKFAECLAEALLDRFEDPDGGFFFTANDHDKLLLRTKSFGDEAMASGSGAAALALGRLGHLLAEPRYLDAAERTLLAAWPEVTALPYAHDTLLHALEERLFPPQLVFLRGDLVKALIWQRTLADGFSPRRLSFVIGEGGKRLPGDSDQPITENVVAYRCDSFACSAPIMDLAELQKELQRFRP